MCRKIPLDPPPPPPKKKKKKKRSHSAVFKKKKKKKWKTRNEKEVGMVKVGGCIYATETRMATCNSTLPCHPVKAGAARNVTPPPPNQPRTPHPAITLKEQRAISNVAQKVQIKTERLPKIEGKQQPRKNGRPAVSSGRDGD